MVREKRWFPQCNTLSFRLFLSTDIPGFFTGTLSDASKVRIPIVAIGRDEGLLLRNSALGEVVMLDELGPGYGYADGTSFSAPIVAGSILALKR